MHILEDCLNSLDNLSKPKSWKNCIPRIEKEHQHFKKLLKRPDISLYGANTLTGHRDNKKVEMSKLISAQEDILYTHAIGQPPFFSEYTSRCITYAKMFSWTAGYSGISPVLFNLISDLSIDSNFSPRIPIYCSYSCGDVIPAAHWANEVLNTLKTNYGYSIQPGDAMMLINGSFVQVGIALSLLKKIKKTWALFVATSSIVYNSTKANTLNLYFYPDNNNVWAKETIDYIKTFAGKQDNQAAIQDPVSLRAIPQIVDFFCNSIEEFIQELAFALSSPSSNPLYDTKVNYPISQASFLLPRLTTKVEAVIESILFAMWSMVNRVNHWLSGKIEGIPIDASNNYSQLGLIQYPKLMMSLLENARLKYGKRIFSTGSQTSYGIEDLWTNGLSALIQFDELLDEMFNFCTIEIFINKYINNNFTLELKKDKDLFTNCNNCNDLQQTKKNINKFIENGRLAQIEKMFPLNFS